MMSAATKYGKGFWNVKIWIFLGLCFVLLNNFSNTNPKSPYWFSDLFLYLLLVIGIWADQKYSIKKHVTNSKSIAMLSYIFLAWAFAMLYETSLTVTGEGIGGNHPYTDISFILAQGDYIPMIIAFCIIIYKLRLSFKEVFFLAGGASLTEGLIFTGNLTKLIASPLFFLAPLVIAYMTLAYSCFLALPLLFINEELLWDNSRENKKRAMFLILLLGFAVAVILRLFLGLIYTPLVIRIFNLSLNTSAIL